MIATIGRGGLKAVVWSLAVIGFAALVLAGLIASPVRRPPELTSISKTAGAVDRSTMPGINRFHARDGTELAYRHYPAGAPPSGQIAVVVHGSSGSSVNCCLRGEPLGTEQNPQPRVHRLPRIMNVAAPRWKHSLRLGQRADSQTVCRRKRRSSVFRA